MYSVACPQSQSERGRERGERDTVKGRMIKRLPRTASVLRYSTRTKHYKLNRIWAFGIRKIQYNTIQLANPVSFDSRRLDWC
jgi:hypothetical protein